MNGTKQRIMKAAGTGPIAPRPPLCEGCMWSVGSTSHSTGRHEKPVKCQGKSPVIYCEDFMPMAEGMRRCKE